MEKWNKALLKLREAETDEEYEAALIDEELAYEEWVSQELSN